MKKIYLRVTDTNTANALFDSSWSDTDGEKFDEILTVFTEKKPLRYPDEKLRDNYRDTVNPERLSRDCFSFTVSPIYVRIGIFCQYLVDAPTGTRLYSLLLCEI